MNLKDLGYDDFFEAGRMRAGLGPYAVARVIAEHRELYRVTDGAGEYDAKVTGKQMFGASSREDYPAVGDWVAIAVLDAEQAAIHGILPRRSVLQRKAVGGSGSQLIAANVDIAFIVQAVGRDFSINRLERYASAVAAGGIRTAIVLNKTDLASPSQIGEMMAKVRSRLPDVGVIGVSTIAPGGLDELVSNLEKGKTYCFIGSSGVGKSSIINSLSGRNLATGSVSARTGLGRHVTTARALFMLGSGAMVIDNPGMREFGILDSVAGIAQVFDAIEEVAASCKFSDCTHANEKGCAVRAAITSGTLDQAQYESYVKLKRESEFHEMTDFQRRRKDRTFGKFIKKMLPEMDES